MDLNEFRWLSRNYCEYSISTPELFCSIRFHYALSRLPWSDLTSVCPFSRNAFRATNCDVAIEAAERCGG